MAVACSNASPQFLMKVAYLNPIGTIGGAERSLLDMMASLKQHRPEIQQHLVVGTHGELAKRAMPFATVHVLEMPEDLRQIGDSAASEAGVFSKFQLAAKLAAAGWNGTQYVGRLRQTLAEINPDVVHSNGFKMHLLGAHAKPAGTPLVWHVRDYVTTRFVMSKALRSTAQACTQAIAITKSVAKDLSVACPGLPIETIEDAIDIDHFRPDGPRLDLDQISNLNPAPNGTVRVGLVATFAKWKGQDVFLQALSKISAQSPVRGYIIGGPVYQTSGSQWSLQELQTMSRQLGLTIGFTGFVDSASAMRALDIVVHASVKPEPLGLVIPEAMACGKPVVVANAGGAAEMYTDRVDALGYRPGDADDMATVISELVDNEPLRARLSAVSPQHVAKRFDRARWGHQLPTMYETLTRRMPLRMAA